MRKINRVRNNNENKIVNIRFIGNRSIIELFSFLVIVTEVVVEDDYYYSYWFCGFENFNIKKKLNINKFLYLCKHPNYCNRNKRFDSKLTDDQIVHEIIKIIQFDYYPSSEYDMKFFIRELE